MFPAEIANPFLGTVVADPLERYVALGNVLAVTESAVRSDPVDPFLNGLLIITRVYGDAACQLSYCRRA